MGDEDKLDIDWDKLTDIGIDYDTLIGTDYHSDTNYNEDRKSTRLNSSHT